MDAPPVADPAADPFAAAYQHLTGRYPQPGEWLAAFSRKVWDRATATERDRQEQHRADLRNYLNAPLEDDENG